MRAFTKLLIFLGAILLAAAALAQTTLVPTTTLAAETGNNTSAASTFSAQSNGNAGAGNISKQPISSLLYPGSSTAIYAHFMAWFGQSNHMNVGYSSTDTAVVARQVNDAISRGMSGFFEDWYGPNNSWPNNTLLALKSEAEQHAGFAFGIVYDGGALKTCAATSGCDLTQQTISDLTYAWNNFEQSPAYLRFSGRPIVMFFDPDRYGTLNWPLIQSSVPGNPELIFRNAGGFTHTSSAGSFGWVIIDTANALDWNASYLDGFYSTGLTYPGEHTMGATYKGFNDTLASWGSNRIMSQQCGQVWLNTLSEIGRSYSASKQLESLQLVTWNDYEEGSELETGVDNCVAVSASVASGVLNWTLSGDEATVDHYTVFISADGQNLMSLGDLPAGSRSLNLAGWNFAAGNYNVFVKATARASMTNKMSAAAVYTVAGAPPPPPGSPDIKVAASPATTMVQQGQTANVSVAITPMQGFSGTVTFTCANLPANARCSFAPGTLAVAGSTISSTLSVATNVASAKLAPAWPHKTPWFTFAFAIAGLVMNGARRRKRLLAAILLAGVLAACLMLSGCGGGSQALSSSAASPVTPTSASTTPVGDYTITITAVSGTLQRTATFTLSVR